MMCRTSDEAFDAGQQDAAALPPPPPAQVTALALLLAPYRPARERAA